MSIFLYYFESRNPNSLNFKGFSDVGAFTVPSNLSMGYTDVMFLGKAVRAGVIGHHLSANDFFIKGKEKLIDELTVFLSKRVQNSAIVAHLACAIESNNDEMIVFETDGVLAMDSLYALFSEVKTNRWCYQLTLNP